MSGAGYSLGAMAKERGIAGHLGTLFKKLFGSNFRDYFLDLENMENMFVFLIPF